MGKKKFIEKKKSATFQLIARDTSDPNYGPGPENDRVFVRVDNNPVSFQGFGEDGQPDDDDIFADAPDDVDDGGEGEGFGGADRGVLPDHVRREILEMGFPDDGYNYLTHLREIKNSGGGSFYYQNPKAASPGLLPLDVKAYDASRVRLHDAKENDDVNEKVIYAVAKKTVDVKVQKVLDPEVVALLDDDESRFGSDVEELEEDFVVQANLQEDGDVNDPDGVDDSEGVDATFAGVLPPKLASGVGHQLNGEDCFAEEKTRVRRLVDEQFDLLELQEYGTDNDDVYDGSIAEEDDSLATKLNNALENRKVSTVELDDEYRAPAELLCGDQGPEDEDAAVVLRRCAEYAEKYQNADEDDHELIIMEESSDESEIWDCETIVSTYSNLDNHPGRIGAPERLRRSTLSETVSKTLKDGKDDIILLGGKEKMPLDYLPNGNRGKKEKVKIVAKNEQPQRHVGQESREEKKERKAAVKEERREARRMKKEVKELYRGEAKRAQIVAAISGPSSIHLM